MDKPKTTRSDDEILAAYEACGGSIRATSKALGNMDRESLRKRLLRLGVRHQDPAIAAAAKSVGTNMIPTLAWAKTKPDENGMAFTWDGLDAAGKRLPPGNYEVGVVGGAGNGSSTVGLEQEVVSVSLGRAGQPLQLNLANGEQVELTRVQQIR